MNESLIPLSLATLCLDCEFISSARGSNCPACGGAALFSLARLLNREPIPTPENLECANA